MRRWLIWFAASAAILLAAREGLSETDTIYKVEQFPGTTADTKLNACAAATASGGVCDARGFGATQQTIAATVFVGTQSSVNGYTAPYQKFLFSPATAFVPASPQVQMFQIGIGANIEGLHIYTGNVRDYAEPAIRFTGSNPSWFYLGSVLRDTVILGTIARSGVPSPAPNSACLALDSSSAATAVAFATIENLACVGEYDGIRLSASGDGYVNTNYFAHISLYAQVNSIDIVTAGSKGASIVGNVFNGLGIQWGNLGFAQRYGIFQHGPGNIAPIRGNTFQGVSIWDTPPDAIALEIADASSTRNYYQGLLNMGLAFDQIQDQSGSYGSNWIQDLNWGNISGTSWRQFLGQSAFSITMNGGKGTHNFPPGLYLSVPVCVLAPASGSDTYTISVSTGSVTITSSSPDDRGTIQGICSPAGN